MLASFWVHLLRFIKITYNALSALIQWNAEIRTRLDFGQTKLVVEQFLFGSNYVRNPNDFVRLSDKNLCPKAKQLQWNAKIRTLRFQTAPKSDHSDFRQRRNPNKMVSHSQTIGFEMFGLFDRSV